jgi:hypothetical protein
VLPNSKNTVRGKKKALSIPSPIPSRRESPDPGPPKTSVDAFQVGKAFILIDAVDLHLYSDRMDRGPLSHLLWLFK